LGFNFTDFGAYKKLIKTFEMWKHWNVTLWHEFRPQPLKLHLRRKSLQSLWKRASLLADWGGRLDRNPMLHLKGAPHQRSAKKWIAFLRNAISERRAYF